MQVMIKAYNVNLEENSQEKCEAELNGIFQAHGCLPHMEFKPVRFLLFIELKDMLG
jgi:hypothetical protein